MVVMVLSSYVTADEAAFIRAYVADGYNGDQASSIRFSLPIEHAEASGRACCRSCGHVIAQGETCVAFMFDKNAAPGHPFANRAVRAYIHNECEPKEEA